MTKLKKVTLSGFRGAPLPLSLDFTDTAGKASSLILRGDNGTGKSTVADAIEFCLQARVGRLAGFNERDLPRIASYATKDSPRVVIEFMDGTTTSRSADVLDGQIRVSDRRVHPDFRLAPVSIKRSDLMRFSTAARNERLVQLLDFLTFHTQPYFPPQEETYSTLETARLEAKDRRRLAAQSVAAHLGIPDNLVPLGLGEFNGFIARYANQAKGHNSPYFPPKLWPLVKAFREASKDVKRLEGEIEAGQKRVQQRMNKAARLAPLQSVLRGLATNLSQAMATIAKDDSIAEILVNVATETEVSLEVNVKLASGVICSPNRILSEGKQDLLTLLIFTGLAKEAATLGQAKFLILDDALQSLSGDIRVRFAEYLLTEFKGFQLMMTVHDRLWAVQLRAIMNRVGLPVVEREIRAWSFSQGPVITNKPGALTDTLAASLPSASPDAICALTGRLLEEVSDYLSCELNTSVSRRQGDRYTLGDTWPGVLKSVRRTTIRDKVEDVERWQPLRNLVGAHFNEWARTLSLSEAQAFANSVLELEAALTCPKCGRVEGTGNPGLPLACRCGQVTIRRAEVNGQ